MKGGRRRRHSNPVARTKSLLLKFSLGTLPSLTPTSAYWRTLGKVFPLRNSESHGRRREIPVAQRSRRRDPHRVFFLIQLYAFEITITIVFLAWLFRVVRHELGY